MFVKLELKKVLREVKQFQVVTKMCQMKRLLDQLLNLVRHPKMEMFCSG